VHIGQIGAHGVAGVGRVVPGARRVEPAHLLGDALAVRDDPVGQGQQVVVSLLGAEIRHQVRCGAAEQNCAPVEPHHLDGDVACVVVGRGDGRRLLVTVVVFFVQDDQPDIRQRGEQRRAGADDHVNIARPGAPPGIVALPGAQRAVDDRHAAWEARREPADGLGSQRDLRHEHNRLSPLGQRALDGAQVNLGFAGAGNAVQHKHAGDIRRRRDLAPMDRIHVLPDGRPGAFLLGGERRRHGGDEFVVGQWVAPGLRFAEQDQPIVGQPLQAGQIGPGPFVNLAHIDWFPYLGQNVQNIEVRLAAAQLDDPVLGVFVGQPQLDRGRFDPTPDRSRRL